MAKITFSDVLSGFQSAETLNDNFAALETELQNKVLYRDNPDGEPNTMESDLDLNSNGIINGGSISAVSATLSGDLTVSGEFTVPTFTAGDSDLLDGQAGSYYLSRTNHTGTQLLSTISDSGTAAAAGTKNSVEIDSGDIQLSGDEASPGNDKYYGTDSSGTKGYYDLPIARVVTESTATRTLALADAGDYILCTEATGCTITLPPQSSVAWEDNTEIHGRGTQGSVVFTEGAGVTINVPPGFEKEAEEGAAWTLKRESSDSWALIGFLVATP